MRCPAKRSSRIVRFSSDTPTVNNPGCGSLLQLLESVSADQVDAVYVSHGHPDHCADLNQLLRARALRETRRRPCPSTRCPVSLMPCSRWTCRGDVGRRAGAARVSGRRGVPHRAIECRPGGYRTGCPTRENG
ncbi:MBL fold metallo-hydrolase [Actinopolymorpha rutila]|uniref:MBL fold metallo-hydrolase n=1 Tax=Actinopolymorpha rutila TaxID=446787 RepID=UPI003B515AE9